MPFPFKGGSLCKGAGKAPAPGLLVQPTRLRKGHHSTGDARRDSHFSSAMERARPPRDSPSSCAPADGAGVTQPPERDWRLALCPCRVPSLSIPTSAACKRHARSRPSQRRPRREESVARNRVAAGPVGPSPAGDRCAQDAPAAPGHAAPPGPACPLHVLETGTHGGDRAL